MTILNIIRARKEILIKKNPSKAISELLKLSKFADIDNDGFLKSTLALAYLENQNYDLAAQIYYELDEKYQAGFCELLLGNESKARELWLNAPESSPVEWGRCLIDLINANIKQLPTFLQIRNHLECDIGYFIRAEKDDYINNILSQEEMLSCVNPETYKFIGRAMINNGRSNQSVEYFLKSQKMTPNDPEIYYYLGQYSYSKGAYKQAIQVLEFCLKMTGSKHFPTINLLEKIRADQNK